MFSSCNSLKYLNLSNFNIKNVIYMNYIFYDCYLLENLDISNFDVQSKTNIYGIF